MAQRSVVETQQTTRTQQKKPFLKYRWMDYFFSNSSNDPTSHQLTIAEFQQRAAWLAVAMILQAANEIQFLTSLSVLVPFALILSSFIALWMALRPNTNKKNKHASTQTSQRVMPQARTWQRIVLILTFMTAIGGTCLCISTVLEGLAAPSFTNDGTALDTNAAILLIQGHNPYTDSNIPELVRRFPITPSETTPLRQGQFANRLDYPSSAELQSIIDTSMKMANRLESSNTTAGANIIPEFEARVSYPALSFLTLLPFALVQNYNVLPFYLLCYILIVFIAWKSVHKELRPWVLLLSMANVPMWASTWGGNLDLLYTLFLLVAWLKRDMRWTSAIFLGLAIATKQIAWYFVPFYALMTIRHYGWKDMLSRLALAGGIALAFNLPFIMWNYQAWFAGIMAPISDPMFPMGVGIISFSTGHLIPYLPEKFYSCVEYAGFALSMLAYWRVCKQRPEAVMLFAIVPLFLAWRSLPSYFYCIVFPAFVLMAAQMKPATQSVLSYIRSHKPENERLPSSVSI